MKTAEEYLFESFHYMPVDRLRIKIVNAINTARKETIEECAERAESEGGYEGFHKVDKQSILSLINELK